MLITNFMKRTIYEEKKSKKPDIKMHFCKQIDKNIVEFWHIDFFFQIQPQ